MTSYKYHGQGTLWFVVKPGDSDLVGDATYIATTHNERNARMIVQALNTVGLMEPTLA